MTDGDGRDSPPFLMSDFPLFMCFGGAFPAPKKEKGGTGERAACWKLLASAVPHHPFELWPAVKLLCLGMEKV